MSATFFIRRREAAKKAKENAAVKEAKEAKEVEKPKKPAKKQVRRAYMTDEELKALDLPIEPNKANCLYVGAAIDWINHKTKLVIDKNNLQESVAALPDGAKLFICRYCEILTTDTNITSESIGGMSQSFGTMTKAQQLWQLSTELMGEYLKSQVSSIGNVSKWVQAMGVRWKTTKNDFPKMERAIQGLNGKKVSVGVLGGGEQSWLASIHEYGCKIKVTPKMRAYLHNTGLHLKPTTTHITIPERAFLRNGFDENKDEVIKNAEQVLGNVLGGTMTPEQFFELVGLLMKSKIQDYARDLDSPPNHPYTVNKKGSSNPLVDTGDMIGAITYKVE